MIAFIGVLISCDILARNWLLTLVADSAAYLASVSSISASLFLDISFDIPIIRVAAPVGSEPTTLPRMWYHFQEPSLHLSLLWLSNLVALPERHSLSCFLKFSLSSGCARSPHHFSS